MNKALDKAEGAIGADECVYQINKWGHGERVKGYADKVVRNRLRAEQRAAIERVRKEINDE